MTTTDTPPFTVARDGRGVTLPLADMARWVTAAAVAASTDPARGSLEGVRFEATGDGAGSVAVATDAFSLVALRVEAPFTGDPFIVPAKALAAAVKAAGKDRKGATPRTVTLSATGGRWTFAVSDGNTATGDTLDSDVFPKWRELLNTPDGFTPATFGAVTFGVAVRVLDKLGGMAAIQWDRMQPYRPATGWVVGGKGITGRLLVMPVRQGDDATVTL